MMAPVSNDLWRQDIQTLTIATAFEGKDPKAANWYLVEQELRVKGLPFSGIIGVVAAYT